MNDDQKPTPIDTIATFAELTLFDKRWFTLYADRVFVQRKLSNGSEAEATVYLDRLNPEAGRGKAKSRLFGIALLVFMLGLFLMLCTNGVDFKWSIPLRKSDWIALACLFGGIIGLLAAFRSIEFCQFTNRDGIVLLSVRRLGSGAAKYEEFIDILVRQIQAARQKTDASGGSTP